MNVKCHEFTLGVNLIQLETYLIKFIAIEIKKNKCYLYCYGCKTYANMLLFAIKMKSLKTLSQAVLLLIFPKIP